MLNGKLADSNLRVKHLQAEMAMKDQHDASSNHNTVQSETGHGHHDVLLQHADMARDVESLKAQVSSHTCHVYDPLLALHSDRQQQLDAHSNVVQPGSQMLRAALHPHYAVL